MEVFGQRNFLTLTAHAHAPNRNVIFQRSARDNLIYAINLAEGITNHALVPTNRIVTSWPVGFSIDTPEVPPPGEPVVNRHPYTIEVNVTAPGQVSQWTKTDASGTALTFDAGLFAGQSFLLDPGDSVAIEYSQAPQWRWKALR